MGMGVAVDFNVLSSTEGVTSLFIEAANKPNGEISRAANSLFLVVS